MHSYDKTCKNQQSPELTTACCTCSTQYHAAADLEHFLPAGVVHSVGCHIDATTQSCCSHCQQMDMAIRR